MNKNKLFYLLPVLFVLLLSCNNTKQSTEAEVLSVDLVLEKALENVDSTIIVSGMVNHVCSHSGRRCFIENESGEQSIRVEASGNIEKFDKSLIGQNLKIAAIIREERLPVEKIDAWEIEVKNDVADAEDGGESCAAELNNIESMRKWMKDNNKDYYAIYYLDGISYEVID